MASGSSLASTLRKNAYPIFLICGMLISGTVATIIRKITFMMEAKGIDGHEKEFAKPYWGTLEMFLGELLVLPMVFGKMYYEKSSGRESEGEKESLVSGSVSVPVGKGQQESVGQKKGPKSYKFLLVLIFTSICDLGGTTVSSIGLLWIPASVYQILRGSIIAFTALFGYVFLKKKVAPVKIFGICVVFAGLAIVGTSAYLASQESNASDQTASSSLVIIGFALVVVGQAFNALQFTVQEVLIERDGVDALSIVGWEGLYGTLMSSFILLPIVQAIPGSDAGSVENSLDTMVMLRNSAALLALNMFVYPIIIALLNGFALLITEHMSALYRCLIDASRVLLVWLVGLLIFYGGSEKYGESWTPYSWMQLGGFVVFFSGMLVYREVIPPVNRFFARLAQKSHMTSLQ